MPGWPGLLLESGLARHGTAFMAIVNANNPGQVVFYRPAATAMMI